MKRLIILPLIVTMSSCATKTIGPVPAGENTYMVARQEGAFPSGREPLLAEALAEAEKHCSGMRKKMKLVSSNENSGPFVAGNYPKATVVFACQ
jgi:hypothetical protein